MHQLNVRVTSRIAFELLINRTMRLLEFEVYGPWLTGTKGIITNGE